MKYKKTSVLVATLCLLIGLSAVTLAANVAGMDTMVDSMDFNNLDVISVYTVLGKLAEWNVVADPHDVTGKITLKVERMRLADALDTVSQITGYHYILDGNTLTVGSLERIKRLIKTEIKFIPVNNLSLATAKTLVETAIPEAVAQGDEKAQRLLVIGTPEQLERAEAIIAQYDTAGKQSFDFQDQPITAILRTLGRSAGINFIVVGDVTGVISFVLSDIAPRDAFNYVVRQAGLVTEMSPEGILCLKPAPTEESASQDDTTAKPATPVVAEETRLLPVKYIPVNTAVDIISAALPSLKVKASQSTSFIAVTGLPSTVQAAEQLLTWHDFPSLRLGGVVQQGSSVVALLEVAGKPHVVKQGDIIGELQIETLSTQGITVQLGSRREYIAVGGTK